MNEILRVLVCLNEDIGNIKAIQSGIIKAQQKTNENFKSASVSIDNISGNCYRTSSGIEDLKDAVENMSILLDNIKKLCFSIIAVVAVVTLSATFCITNNQEYVSSGYYNLLMQRCQNITMLLAKKNEFWYSVKNKKLFFRKVNLKHK